MNHKKVEFEKIDKAVQLAINHIVRKGCDDIFKPPSFAISPEKSIIDNYTEEFRKEAKQQATNFLKKANFRDEPIGRAKSSLVPKDEHTYRQVAWIDPFDCVKFLALSIFLFDTIDDKRLPKNENILHSHRKSDQPEILFDEAFGYDSFKKNRVKYQKKRGRMEGYYGRFEFL